MLSKCVLWKKAQFLHSYNTRLIIATAVYQRISVRVGVTIACNLKRSSQKLHVSALVQYYRAYRHSGRPPNEDRP